MKTLFLRIADLSANDVRQIEMFLRFAGRTPQFQWTATAGNLVDLELASLAQEGHSGNPSTPMPDDGVPRAWILDRGQQAPGRDAFVLRRPLQMDGFEALLRTRELEIGRDAGAAPAAAAAVRADGASAPFVDDDRTVYRLLKWPAPDLLRGKPTFVRALGFLSTRALTLKRLAALTGVGEAACRELLMQLDQRRLLIRNEHFDASASVADIVGTPSRSAAGVRPGESANAGLFSRLRKRLGLG